MTLSSSELEQRKKIKTQNAILQMQGLGLYCFIKKKITVKSDISIDGITSLADGVAMKDPTLVGIDSLNDSDNPDAVKGYKFVYEPPKFVPPQPPVSPSPKRKLRLVKD